MTESGSEVPVLTIDGPGGSGKGTISLIVARRLGWHLLDSGALYRLVGQAAFKHKIPFNDAVQLEQIARELDASFDSSGPENRIILEGQDVTDMIRTEEAGDRASMVAAVTEVRDALLQRQRDFRQPPGLVADGRDMGTTVFPDAPVKIFLAASAEERAKRRYKQLKEKGISVNFASLFGDIQARDRRDADRSVSPLKPAVDAVTVDTTEMSIDEVVEKVMALVSQAIRE